MSRDGFIKGPRAEFCSIKSPFHILLLLLWVKVLLEPLPAFVVLLVQLFACLLTPLGQRKAQGALKHESLSIKQLNYLSGWHWL